MATEAFETMTEDAGADAANQLAGCEEVGEDAKVLHRGLKNGGPQGA